MLKAVLGGKLTEEMLTSFDFQEQPDLWKLGKEVKRPSQAVAQV